MIFSVGELQCGLVLKNNAFFPRLHSKKHINLLVKYNPLVFVPNGFFSEAIACSSGLYRQQTLANKCQLLFYLTFSKINF